MIVDGDDDDHDADDVNDDGCGEGIDGNNDG